jgi:hypothetical protein
MSKEIMPPSRLSDVLSPVPNPDLDGLCAAYSKNLIVSEPVPKQRKTSHRRWAKSTQRFIALARVSLS